MRNLSKQFCKGGMCRNYNFYLSCFSFKDCFVLKKKKVPLKLLSWININYFPIPCTDKEPLTNYQRQPASLGAF